MEDGMSNLSRRSLIGTAAALPALAIPAVLPSAASAESAPTQPAAADDGELVALVDQLFEAEREFGRLNAIHDKLDDPKRKDKAGRGPKGVVAARRAEAAASDRLFELIEQVADTPATTLRGTIAKARCCAWFNPKGNWEDMPFTDPNNDILRSLVFDLMAIGGLKPLQWTETVFPNGICEYGSLS
jgi:hypothetical protein